MLRRMSSTRLHLTADVVNVNGVVKQEPNSRVDATDHMERGGEEISPHRAPERIEVVRGWGRSRRSNGALRLASLLQDLDRHDLLPCEHGQGGASQRALDVQDQLGTRLARLSMDVQYDGRTESVSGS